MVQLQTTRSCSSFLAHHLKRHHVSVIRVNVSLSTTALYTTRSSNTNHEDDDANNPPTSKASKASPPSSAAAAATSFAWDSNAEYPLDTTPDITNTAQQYHRHILIPTGTHQWPSKVELEYPYMQTLLRQFTRFKMTPDSLWRDTTTKLSAVDIASFGDPLKATVDMVVFPESVRVSKFPLDQLPSLPHLLHEFKSATQQNMTKQQWPHGVEVHEWKGQTVVVCTHGSRDCRCGTVGEHIYSQLATRLARLLRHEESLTNVTPSPIRVLRSSHVGGHKYAANVIVYPSGHFFGNIRTEEDVDDLCRFLETRQVSERLQHKLRGQMGGYGASIK